MADIEVHFSKLVIFSNNIQSLICGLVGLLYLVLNEFGILCFISGWSELAYFLAAVFLSAFDFSETSPACLFCSDIFAFDHIFDLT